jgi:putative DNA primase/helicase
MTAPALAEVLHARRVGAGRWMAKCPAHPDRNPSLSIAEAPTGHILLKCHAGCAVEFILDALNLTVADICAAQRHRGPKGEMFVAAYDYHDPSGKLVCQAVRYASPKNFRQRRPDGKGGWIRNMDGVTRVPFNLPMVIQSNVVLIAEGEKDALKLQEAVTIPPTNYSH